ncbi:hypothetical protein [Streptomyces sp. NPDC055749]
MSPALDERDRIRAAMDRILTNRPEHSNGALTMVTLAQEAQVPRNAFTQRHPDLRTSSTHTSASEAAPPTPRHGCAGRSSS